MKPQDIVDRYAKGGEILAYAAQGLTPDQARATPGPGAWSLAQLVAHLADCDLVHADRMKRVIAEDDARLLAFDENAWVGRLRSQDLPIGDAVALFAANRRWTAAILRSLDDADFARAGTHSEAGRKTLAEVVVGAAGHLDHHLNFLYGKRGNLGVALYPRYSHSPTE